VIGLQVFRTYNASITLDRLLSELEADSTSLKTSVSMKMADVPSRMQALPAAPAQHCV
jgi:hypothetical protein